MGRAATATRGAGLATRAAAVLLVVAVGTATAARAPAYQVDGGPEIVDLDPDSLRTPPAAYVGAMVCRECHREAFEAWLGTAHARSWVFLAGAAADSVAARMEGGPVAQPPRSARCLACHGTAADVAPAWRDRGLHVQDGVQCEACHGPGSKHIEPGLVIAGADLRASRMRRPREADCRVCHKRQERPSHDWMQRRAFDFARDRARIAHPASRRERLQVLWARPGACVSIGLRTVLGHWFGS